jgi:hypothetical protein
MADDFDKRDFLSPLRIAIQEAKKAKEMDNDAQKASQQRNNEAMWSQVDSFIIGLCDIFDIPGQIGKAIRQSVGRTTYRYEFSLSVSSCFDYQQVLERAPYKSLIKSKLSERLPNMDNELLMDWIEKLYSIPSAGKALESISKPYNAPNKQGTIDFLRHMKNHFFVLLREGFLRDGIELHHCTSGFEKIYKNNEKEIECGAVGDYIGSQCKSSEECTGLCDSPRRCNWAFNEACFNCTVDNWRHYKDDCTSRIENWNVSLPKLSFWFTINVE